MNYPLNVYFWIFKCAYFISTRILLLFPEKKASKQNLSNKCMSKIKHVLCHVAPIWLSGKNYCLRHGLHIRENLRFFNTAMEFSINLYASVLKAPSRN